MTVFTRPGWQQNAGAVHNAEQMRNYVLSMASAGSGGSGSMQARGGVHPALGFELQVTQTGSPSMGVLVRSGLCSIPGTEGAQQGAYGLGNDGDITLAIAASHATLARIDLVIARIRDTAYSGVSDNGTIEVVTGTPAGSPVAPSTPANSLVLAQVAVAGAATTIVNANITDTRRFLAAPGGVIPARSTDSHVNTLNSGQPVYETDTGRMKFSTDNGTTFKTIFTGTTFNVFTASGTWNKPTGAQRVRVRCVGGGGSGGNSAAAAAGQCAKGGGGGGGAYSESWFDASALAASVSVTIGAGGIAGGAGAGTTSFGAHVTAPGGSAGGSGTSSGATGFGTLGGAGGVPGTGQVAANGQAGACGTGGQNLGIGGSGGCSALGSGAQGTATGTAPSSNNGVTAVGFGGGGGGALSTASGAAATGGNGAPGICIVETFGV
jgi:hypothetical protein